MKEITVERVEDIPTEHCEVYVSLDNDMFVKIVDELAKRDFCMPKIMKKNHKLYLNLSNQYDNNLDTESLLNHINSTLEQLKNGHACDVDIQISQETIDYLRNLPISHRKEHSGTLYTKEIKRQMPERYIHVLTFDDDSIVKGGDEDVSVAKSKFNFHSHPREAYLAHHVKRGWPSKTDYVGYYQLGNNTIFHCVTTLEGLYIISFRYKKVKGAEQFIKDNYDIDKKLSLTPQQFCDKVNSLKSGIFKVEFATWSELPTKIFTIRYPKNGLNCITFD